MGIVLPHHNWDLAVEERVEYPSEMVAPFVEYLLTSKRWHDDVTLVQDKLQRLQLQMADYRATRRADVAEEEAATENAERMMVELASAFVPLAKEWIRDQG